MATATAQPRVRGTLNVVRQQRRLSLSAMPLQPTHQPLAGVVEQLVVAWNTRPCRGRTASGRGPRPGPAPHPGTSFLSLPRRGRAGGGDLPAGPQFEAWAVRSLVVEQAVETKVTVILCLMPHMGWF